MQIIHEAKNKSNSTKQKLFKDREYLLRKKNDNISMDNPKRLCICVCVVRLWNNMVSKYQKLVKMLHNKKIIITQKNVETYK